MCHAYTRLCPLHDHHFSGIQLETLFFMSRLYDLWLPAWIKRAGYPMVTIWLKFFFYIENTGTSVKVEISFSTCSYAFPPQFLVATMRIASFMQRNSLLGFLCCREVIVIVETLGVGIYQDGLINMCTARLHTIKWNKSWFSCLFICFLC